MKQIVTLLAVLTFLAGCSLFTSEKKKEGAPASTAADSEDASQSWFSNSAKHDEPVTSLPVVKITWQRPDEPVTGYVLRYGFEKQNLDREIKIAVTDLVKEDDPKFGPVYRYRLQGVPEGKPLFISLQASNPDGVSPPSPVTEVKPG